MPKAAKKSSENRVNKSAWIRSQPVKMPAKDVVDKAKAKGIKLSLAQVYTARSTAKNSKGKAGRMQGRGSATGAGKQSGSDSELQFRRLVLAIGLPKAELYLTELKHSVGL